MLLMRILVLLNTYRNTKAILKRGTTNEQNYKY